MVDVNTAARLRHHQLHEALEPKSLEIPCVSKTRDELIVNI